MRRAPGRGPELTTVVFDSYILIRALGAFDLLSIQVLQDWWCGPLGLFHMLSVPLENLMVLLSLLQEPSEDHKRKQYGQSSSGTLPD